MKPLLLYHKYKDTPFVKTSCCSGLDIIRSTVVKQEAFSPFMGSIQGQSSHYARARKYWMPITPHPRLQPINANLHGAEFAWGGAGSLEKASMAKRQSFRKGVESALHARDTTGVQDFVLLEDYTSEDAFLDNLQKRFKSNLIYVSLLQVSIVWIKK